ncbi:hypothetical protein [Thermaerobacter subterraneus]|uniref:Glycosyltransferase RgtA/B/C/D-like domain-containing protein n=1 Tax=Thermaerobacter subterraneus DSM 13965 TaxID=867903 RepID=K6NZ25_9FIRM|nr:hypothetical protein [Thermaerobacter subterraneus]EKP94110.1 hypothetical protein ThesuDRAFT_01835 [Thermaerobacter subterraneus DSM 13965]
MERTIGGQSTQNACVMLFILISLAPVLLYIVQNAMAMAPDIPDSKLYMSQFVDGLRTDNLAVRFYYVVYAPLQLAFGPDPIVSVMLNGVFNALTAGVSWLAYRELALRANVRVLFIFGMLFLLWPALARYSSAPVRESMFLMTWSLFIYGASRGTGMHLFMAVMGGLCVVLLRPEFLPVVLLVHLVFVVARIKSQWRIPMLVFGSVAMVWAGRWVMGLLNLDHLLSPERIAWERNYAVIRYGEDKVYGQVQWTSWVDVVKDAPKLLLWFLLSPFGTSDRPFQMVVAALDAVFSSLVILAGLCSFVTQKQRRETVWMACVAMVAISMAIVEYHVVGAVRHRMPVILMLLPPAASGIEHGIRNIIRKSRLGGESVRREWSNGKGFVGVNRYEESS